jgi:hypothetical protein
MRGCVSINLGGIAEAQLLSQLGMKAVFLYHFQPGINGSLPSNQSRKGKRRNGYEADNEVFS